MVDQKRLKHVEASLSFSPLPRDELDWWHEPSLRLLSEEESEGLAAIFEKLEGGEKDFHTMETLSRLRPDELSLLETFIRKSQEGMAWMKAHGFPTVLQMNMATRLAA